MKGMKNNVTIRIGAAYWDAKVRHGDTVVEFDFSTMTREQRRLWRVTLVKAFRVASEAA